MKPIDLEPTAWARPLAEPTIAANPQDDDARYRARLEQAAEKFEAFFIADMLRQMRRSAREIAGEDSPGSRINAEMLDVADTRVADVLAGQRAFGIADVILRQMLPAQSAAPVPPTAPEQVLKKAD